MAVQAQYPSNLLLYNTRNGQDTTKNMLLQQPPTTTTATPTFLLHQSHLLVDNNGGAEPTPAPGETPINPRKRGREPLTTTTTAAANHNHPFTFSLHNHPQLIHLSQLQHHNPNAAPALVYTGLNLSSFDHDQQIQHHNNNCTQHNNNTTDNHNNYHPTTAGTTSCTHNPTPAASPTSSILFSDDLLSTHFNKHSDQINQFIHTQGNHLRRTVTEKRHKQYRTLLSAADDSITHQLRQKETELAKATKRHNELEARAAQLTTESNLWQAKARAQNAQAASLQAQLHQAMMIIATASPGINASAATSKPVDVDDGLDGCGGGHGDVAVEDAQSGYVDPDRVVETIGLGATTMPGCRACKMRPATVVILPCRHMCLCVECDDGGGVQGCPVCFGIRNSSVEVYLT